MKGNIDQGNLKTGQQIKFLPHHSNSNKCTGRVAAIEQHHQAIPEALPGDNYGINVKGISNNFKPKRGDVLLLEDDESIKKTKIFLSLVYSIKKNSNLVVGSSVLLCFGYLKVNCKVISIDWRCSIKQNYSQKKFSALNELEEKDFAQVAFEPKNFFAEPFAYGGTFSKFVIIEKRETSLLGLVTNALPFDFVWSPQLNKYAPQFIQKTVYSILRAFKRIQNSKKIKLPKPILYFLISKSIQIEEK